MSEDWPQDKIDAHHKLVNEIMELAKYRLGCDGIVIIAVFNDGPDHHLFDAADCELSAPEIYIKMLTFHMELLEKEADKPVKIN